MGLVDYQDGAVVSRTLMDKQTGTVTLFAFDKIRIKRAYCAIRCSGLYF